MVSEGHIGQQFQDRPSLGDTGDNDYAHTMYIRGVDGKHAGGGLTCSKRCMAREAVKHKVNLEAAKTTRTSLHSHSDPNDRWHTVENSPNPGETTHIASLAREKIRTSNENPQYCASCAREI